ncbi:hypothetical protein HNR00_000501 [Methylorubrum rhodinum]|jgi:hypothetical protein|uniref:Secreted protein n=1 Tax=Methylorubrum rhodinum TaxID=29428 RepID=A0A840ZF57_9HYPH|nr:hypothetical protein [Methylorubrum rhodinum]MBB5755805.1 hypothetical protein [Methylorubrum rhodinum]
MRRCLAALLFLVVAAPVAVPSAAWAGPAQDYTFGEQRFRNACPPPLKYAAGACVRRCPAGYEAIGRYCRFRSMRR